MNAKQAAILGVPGTVTVNETIFVIEPPTPADSARVSAEMERLASLRCVNPLAAVGAVPQDALSGADRVEAIRAAVGMVSGGGVKPSREAVIEQYSLIDGVRFRLWYAARKADKTLTRDAVAALVTDDNFYDVDDALNVAMGYKNLDPKSQQASGTN